MVAYCSLDCSPYSILVLDCLAAALLRPLQLLHYGFLHRYLGPTHQGGLCRSAAMVVAAVFGLDTLRGSVLYPVSAVLPFLVGPLFARG